MKKYDRIQEKYEVSSLVTVLACPRMACMLSWGAISFILDFQMKKYRKTGLPTSPVTALCRQQINRAINLHLRIVLHEITLVLPIRPLYG